MNSTKSLSPHQIASECYCLALRRASRALTRRYDEAFVGLDINSGQFSMLTSIAGMQPVSVQELAEHLAMDRTTVTAALKPLERRGLIKAEASANDLRTRSIYLTPEGKSVLAQATPLWLEAQAKTELNFTDIDTIRLREELFSIK
jgi:DNA-binding MarR family transcriptional regulator